MNQRIFYLDSITIESTRHEEVGRGAIRSLAVVVTANLTAVDGIGRCAVEMFLTPDEVEILNQLKAAIETRAVKEYSGIES